MNTTEQSIQFSAATCDDAGLIVNAVREGFAHELLQLMTYGCAGISEFVREQIAVQDAGGDLHYTVARCGDDFSGAAEIRRIPDGLFLNYIAVASTFRRQGFGSLLFREALNLIDVSERTTIMLDVLEHNFAARRWYDRLGFRTERRTQWWTSPLGATGLNTPVTIEGYPQAQACQREYGFSRFRIHVGGTPHEIGRLGEKWYRLTDPATASDPVLTDWLNRFDRNRQLLLLAPENWTPSQSAARVVARTWRLTAPVQIVIENLDRYIGERNLISSGGVDSCNDN